MRLWYGDIYINKHNPCRQTKFLQNFHNIFPKRKKKKKLIARLHIIFCALLVFWPLTAKLWNFLFLSPFFCLRPCIDLFCHIAQANWKTTIAHGRLCRKCASAATNWMVAGILSHAWTKKVGKKNCSPATLLPAWKGEEIGGFCRYADLFGFNRTHNLLTFSYKGDKLHGNWPEHAILCGRR